MERSKPALLTMKEFAAALGVSRPTARKIAKHHPGYLVPHGEKGVYSYVKASLVPVIINCEDTTKEVPEDAYSD